MSPRDAAHSRPVVRFKEGIDVVEVVNDLSPGALLWAAGLSWDSLSDVCNVSARTVQRWRQRGELPALLVLFLACFQDLGIIAPAWAGWQLSHKKGELYSPEGVGYRPGDLLAMHFRLQQINVLRGRVTRLEQELAARPPLRPQRWRPSRAQRARPDHQHRRIYR